MAVDDQNGFTINLLQDTSYVVTLSGDHGLTAEGDIAIFVPLSEGSCSAVRHAQVVRSTTLHCVAEP